MIMWIINSMSNLPLEGMQSTTWKYKGEFRRFDQRPPKQNIEKKDFRSKFSLYISR
jgi:hypothetical protein